MPAKRLIFPFEEIGLVDLPSVGGKNASLGEMEQQLGPQGIRLAPGFAVSAQVYRDYLADNDLEGYIGQQLEELAAGSQSLSETGGAIRSAILGGHFSDEQADAIRAAYDDLCKRAGDVELPVAVRSSATAEDLPEASFAGQQDSFLNVSGNAAVLDACRRCMASLYTDRAIAYREEHGFDHQQVALSVGVQQMVDADAAGVMFSLDTETGFPDVVLISAAWGLGETVVKGSVNPDRFMVYKPLLDAAGKRPIIEKQIGSKLKKMVYGDVSDNPTTVVDTSIEEQGQLVLSDNEVLTLAAWAVAIEQHYKTPMDMEWARDRSGGELFILQARPETVESTRDRAVLVSYTLKESGELLLEGASVGAAIAVGPVCHASSPAEAGSFPEGGILVTERTDPDWMPVMRKAGGIITDSGGPTSHAAIVSREMKLPAIVGTGHGTRTLKPGAEVTLSCAEGAVGKVYAGSLAYEMQEFSLADIPATRTDIMLNVGMPDAALRWWALPVVGIGLARIEFMISSQIRVHPMALLHPERITDEDVLSQIRELTRAYPEPSDYFVENLALGLGKIAASRYPGPVIVRTSDFKSNEYRELIGGKFFEPHEENPMLGLRGASRYYHPVYREGFQLECRAIRHAREVMGFDNIIVMIPFCRTPEEADKVLEAMAEAGLSRGDGLEIYVMCEIPSNIVLAEEFAKRFDGFSIGSNDLTQLVLGIDRDSAELKSLFDARNDAVKRMIEQVIGEAHRHGCKVGICGQAPSDHPDFAQFLVTCGIDSISLNPDSVLRASRSIADAEKTLT